MEEVFKFIKNYWSEIFLFLTYIGIGIKMFLGFLLRRKEIEYEHYSKNKLDSLIRFYNAYSALKTAWDGFPIWRFYLNKISGEEIDEYIWQHKVNFESSVIEMQLYFKGNKYSKFIDIKENMIKIDVACQRIKTNELRYKSKVVMVNNFQLCRDDLFKKNDILLKEINDFK